MTLGIIIMTLGIIILLAVVTVCAVIAYAFLKSPKPQLNMGRYPCFTSHISKGGTLICQTHDIIEIVTCEGTETVTVAEYARKAE
jgi:hypothetical protein